MHALLQDPIAYGLRMVKPRPLTHAEASEIIMPPADEAAQLLLQHEQLDCPVVHYFGPGLYIREVKMPAGAMVVGHKHCDPHMNVMLTGRMTLYHDNGTTQELVAPMRFVGSVGHKRAYIHETVTWQNVYSTNETDIETLEETLLDKPDWLRKRNEQLYLADLEARQADRDDLPECFALVTTDEITPLPWGGYKVAISRSAIHGKGVLMCAKAVAGEILGPAFIHGKNTPLGRYINHAKQPNAELIRRPDGTIDLVALRDLIGCRGGDYGEEVTIDYRQGVRTWQQ